MVLSILHRSTGVALAIGLLMLTVWLVLIATDSSAYERFVALINTVFGHILMVGWTFAFFLHFANGVRHLVWDLGHGFEKHQADRSAWLAITFAVAATAAFWWCVT